jgi:hypothetical protein
MRLSFASDQEQPVPAAPAFMTTAMESGRSAGIGIVGRTPFRATPVGIAAIVGEAGTSDNAATGASDVPPVF